MFPLPQLRSGFRRRGQSNPTSPVPDQVPSLWESSAFHEHPYAAQDVSPRPDSRPESSNSSHFPPTLPPITRVTSADQREQFQQPQQHTFSPREVDLSQDGRAAPIRAQRTDGSTAFVGGVALRNRLRDMHEGTRQESNSASSTGPARETLQPRSRVPPPPINTGIASQRPPPLQKAGSSFVTPTDLQQLAGEPHGRRPAGTRLATEPPMLASHAQLIDAPKGRRGFSSLKDRLLMKRKTTAAAAEPVPVSTRFSPEVVFHDPRIRGTRIHDFSTPRPTRPTPQPQMSSNQSIATTVFEAHNELAPSSTDDGAVPQGKINLTNSDTLSLGILHDEQSFAGSVMSSGTAMEDPDNHWQVKPHPPSLDQALPVHPVELKDTGTSVNQGPLPAVSVATSRRGSSTMPRASTSSRTLRSRDVSFSEPARRDSNMSAIPRHMKSTSSRFSFDIDGAAKQEKLLEEKHRQRQIEQGNDITFAGKDRDSRFDEFDNEDIDYDAMMDDDGLEERIPGVNADWEEEEDYPAAISGVNGDVEEEYILEEDPDEEADPDDDQENFAGFVFQRSNPASTVASPMPSELLPTPRDPTGKVIGFAMTKDTTPDLAPEPSPPFQNTIATDSSEGLGIQGYKGDPQLVSEQKPCEEDHRTENEENLVPLPSANDDLYYEDGFIDDGLRDELDFGPVDGPAFDESLLDLNDTDKYGRPIPGAFAHAKSMWAAQQQTSRQSDETSRISEQSPASQSTAHTSVDAGLQPAVASANGYKAAGPEYADLPERRSSLLAAPSSVLAYQAALAEAAHKAAASGKFRRGSSPPPLANLTITSPTDSTESHAQSQPENAVDLDVDDLPSRGLDDDYDFDDDVIAEANAEALANDSDGWYGREFGFYSAPLPVPSHGHGHGQRAPSALSDSSPKPLSAENLFQYANGGYFGPAGAGMERMADGRLVSREPNLTPITERSEYSNRNSIMSYGIGGGFNSAGGPGGQQLQNPGLAELAMMDDDANMNMSALIKLRSRAFGASSRASLRSSPEGSPRSEFSPAGLGWTPRDGATSPWGAGPGSTIAGAGAHALHVQHGRKSSMISLQSASDGGSGAGSPTLTMTAPPVPSQQQQQQGLHPSAHVMYPVMASSPVLAGPPVSFPPVPEEESLQPVCVTYRDETLQQHHLDAAHHTGVMSSEMILQSSPAAQVDEGTAPQVAPQLHINTGQQQQPKQRPAMAGHRHKTSADSISYVKEGGEEGGEARWVMERRRTAETGEVEFVEREIVGNI